MEGIGRNEVEIMDGEIRFFTMVYIDPRKNFKKVSTYKIFKYLQEIGPEIHHKLLKNGTLLLKTDNVESSKQLLHLKIRLFDHSQIRISPHPNLNYTRGVVFFPGLGNCSGDEILNELGPQGVLECKSLTPNNASLYVLKFKRINLPEYIFIGYTKVPVKPFIPLPLRCFDCLCLGRHAGCGNKVCETCGLSAHAGLCTAPAKCVNCSESHSSFSKDCKVYLTEKEIQRIRVTKKISYHEAEQIVRKDKSIGPRNPILYALEQKTDGDNDVVYQIKEIISKLEKTMQLLTHQESKSKIKTFGTNQEKTANTDSSPSRPRTNVTVSKKLPTSYPPATHHPPVSNSLDVAKLRAKMFG